MVPDGFTPIKFTGDFNVKQRDACLANMAANSHRGLPIVMDMQKPHDTVMAIAGAGPGLKDCVVDLLSAQRSGAHVCAVNESHDWLVREAGIEPDMVVYTEVAPWAGPLFNEKTKNTNYFISSSADGSVFDALKDRKVTVWHAWHGIGEENVVRANGGGAIVYGGVTPALRAIHLGVVLGYRCFDLFGMESSYETNSHVGRDGEREGWETDQTLDIWCAGRVFKTKPYLASQANDFGKIAKRYGNLISFRVHGDGLLPHLFKTMCGTDFVRAAE